MEHLKRKAEVAKFHAGMETGVGPWETESADRFLGMEVKVERSGGWEEKQKKKITLTSGIDCFW